MRRIRPAVLIPVLGALMAAGAPAGAQVIRGAVLEDGTGRALDEVRVLLRRDGRTLDEVVTDSTGSFRLRAPRPGQYTLRAERIGLATVESPELSVRGAEAVEVVVRMAAAAVPLDPLTVETRRPLRIGPIAGYYERMSWNERTGVGRIISRDEIEESNAFYVSDLLRMVPRVTVVASGGGRGAYVTFRGKGGCRPSVYLDGVLANRGDGAFVDELVGPYDLEGIEVYQGLAQMPGEYYDQTGCGVILLWTRRGGEGGRPLNWKRALAALGAAGLLLLIAR